MQLKQSAPQVTDSALRLPGEVPEIPPAVIERFPEMSGWMTEFKRFWNQNTNAVNDFARAVLDVTEIGGLFVVDGANQSIYVKGTRDRGAYRDPDTPVYFDKAGYFSLKQKLYWDPTTNILTIDGTIFAEAGNIGGFEIGADFIRDEADSFGLSSAVTGANDVRFWAGDTFANRAIAPFRVYESGAVFASNATISGPIIATSGSIGGFDIGPNYIRDVANSFGLASVVTAGDDVRFWAGDTFANRATAPFRLTESGIVTALNGTFSGTITSSSGTIGGFTLGPTSLAAGAGLGRIQIVSGGAGNILFGVVGSTASTLIQANTISTQNAASVTEFNVTGGNIVMVGSVTAANCLMGNGSLGAPSYSFQSDPDTGWRWNSAGDMRAVTNSSDRLVIRDAAVVFLTQLELFTSFVAGAPAATGTVTMKDAAGVAYRFLCAP